LNKLLKERLLLFGVGVDFEDGKGEMSLAPGTLEPVRAKLTGPVLEGWVSERYQVGFD
jgi:hypothetical protein